MIQDITMKRNRSDRTSSAKEVPVESSVTSQEDSNSDEDYDPAEYCQIRVRLMTCLEVEVDRDSTIEELKQKFQEISGTSSHLHSQGDREDLHLIHNGRRLDQKKTLADYGIKDNDSIWLTTISK